MRFFWRLAPHQHVPFRPGRYTLWYCGRCMLALSWAGWKDPPEWHVFRPPVRYSAWNTQ